jgi:hypothetical protein
LEWEAALEEIGEIRDFDCVIDRIADEVRHTLLYCAALEVKEHQQQLLLLRATLTVCNFCANMQGLEPSIRPDVWPFLLEVFDPASHYQQRQAQHQLMLRQYQQLLLQCQVRLAALS